MAFGSRPMVRSVAVDESPSESLTPNDGCGIEDRLAVPHGRLGPSVESYRMR